MTNIEVHPLDIASFPDFETLFGPNGACAGCWCMFPRLRQKDYEAGKGDVNHQRMRELVESGATPGLLGYLAETGTGGDARSTENRTPVAWISLGPREEFVRWKNSKVLAPVDDKPVWVVVCLFIAKGYRRTGISVEMLKAAGEYAKSQGATILEGYPTDPAGKKKPDAWVWTGLQSAYEKAGFVEVARRSPSRPIMRLNLEFFNREDTKN